MHSVAATRVATPLRAQRSNVELEGKKDNVQQSRAEVPPATPDVKLPVSRSAGLRATAAKQTKASSKRAGTSLCNKVQGEGAEDSGRLQPAPAKRCKLLDEGGEEPTAEMRSLTTCVVNLDRRPDRMEGCSERLRLNCPWLEHSRFDASDGRRDAISLDEVVKSWNTASNVVYQKQRAIRKGWDDLDSYQVRDLVLSPGERGCALSHIRAWRLCLEMQRVGEPERPLLVLEDDADPTPQFTSVLRRALASLPSDAHLLYLGYSQAADWRREVSENLVESEYVWTTVGYLVWPAGARIMLASTPVDGPVDNWMAGLAAARDVNAYAVRPKIVLQADAWNVNSDVAHSDEHYWGADSDIRHSDHLYWGNPGTSEERSSSCSGLPGLAADRSTTMLAGIDDDSEESEDSAGEA